MKFYTTIDQSEILMKFIPLDTADMCWGINYETLKYNNLPYMLPYCQYTAKEFYIPCWSLSSLISLLPKGVHLIKSTINDEYTCKSDLLDIEIWWYETPIEACIAYLIELYEQKILFI